VCCIKREFVCSLCFEEKERVKMKAIYERGVSVSINLSSLK
jgi:hypothetical protein